MGMQQEISQKIMKKRFDGYLPVVVDVETGGVDSGCCALLEVAACSVEYRADGVMIPSESVFSTHVVAFEGSVIEPEALKINGIDPHHPFRFAIPENEALEALFAYVNQALMVSECRRAVLVGHNAHFDLSFLNAAMVRCSMKKGNPFHAFTCFDTATLGGAAFGKTILAKALKEAKIDFDKHEAHSAVYDTSKTTELFCQIINAFDAVSFVS